LPPRSRIPFYQPWHESRFRRQQIKLTEVLDASCLYPPNIGNPDALELLPFVRVIAGSAGQDACY
jgi:hypothetical protein